MEQRPLSKLAVASLILSIASLISITILIIIAQIGIDFERFIGHYLIIILGIILGAFVLGTIPGFILGILALKRINKNNIRGKGMANAGVVINGLILVSFVFLILTAP